MNVEDKGDASILTLVTHVVEQHGCKLVDFDLENKLINIEGPEAAKVACALALQDLLDQ
ncbi:MAG: hypothetical protein WBG37_06425 [Desulfobacterales bacterium]|jgi:hypothetical protein